MNLGRPKKPADAFEVGERVWHNGRNVTVAARRYLEGRRRVELTLAPDRGIGDRIIFESGDYLELGDAPPRWRRWLGRLFSH